MSTSAQQFMAGIGMSVMLSSCVSVADADGNEIRDPSVLTRGETHESNIDLSLRKSTNSIRCKHSIAPTAESTIEPSHKSSIDSLERVYARSSVRPHSHEEWGKAQQQIIDRPDSTADLASQVQELLKQFPCGLADAKFQSDVEHRLDEILEVIPRESFFKNTVPTMITYAGAVVSVASLTKSAGGIDNLLDLTPRAFYALLTAESKSSGEDISKLTPRDDEILQELADMSDKLDALLTSEKFKTNITALDNSLSNKIDDIKTQLDRIEGNLPPIGEELEAKDKLFLGLLAFSVMMTGLAWHNSIGMKNNSERMKANTKTTDTRVAAIHKEINEWIKYTKSRNSRHNDEGPNGSSS